MISTIKIKNFILFLDETINLKNGSNALVGQTGAGKSIIIKALSVLKGERNDKSLIMIDKEFYELEVTINIKNIPAKIKEKIIQILPTLSSDEIIIYRYLNKEGKGQIRINGVLVNLKELKEIGDYLIDIHEQNATIDILKTNNNIKVIDSFIPDKIKTNYQMKFKEYVKIITELKDLEEKVEKTDELLELLDYQIKQIEAVENIEKEEELEEKIEQNKKKVIEQEKNIELKNIIDNIEPQMYQLINIIENSKDINMNEIFNQFKISWEELTYIVSQNKNEEELESIDELMDKITVIRQLKRKYNLDYEGLVTKLNDLKLEKEELLNMQDKIVQLDHQKTKITQDLKNYQIELSEQRKMISTKIEKEINEYFQFLEMKEAKLKIEIEETKLSYNGKENITFMIRTNEGHSYQPIEQIASGGEKSRIMLILKKVMQEIMSTPILILDEIDQGLSPLAAKKVGILIKEMAEKIQIIAITHTPQVLSQLNNYVEINKENIDGITLSKARELNQKEKNNFIDNMLQL